ncbi:unnamed protein product [Adineta steineri]|uniref:Uncharacterized protein n=1 Tax=Adineta steineri TaxID=433720 RepID=A0A815D9T7_9BILA|nr:unnamed protein product [Adineta steineri]CAF4074670.1 unnamed protein product [Adineta steineri]
MHTSFIDDHYVSDSDMQQQQPIIQVSQNSQSLQQHKRNKKSRGIRKLQRYRRKIRKQTHDTDSINQVSNTVMDKDVLSISDELTNETIVDHSNAVIENDEIIQQPLMDNKTDIKLNQDISTKEENLQMVTNDSVDYKTISDDIFIQMLSTASYNTDKLDQLMNIEEQVSFICEYTNLIDRLCYLQLQQSQWNYYHHIGITHNIWTGRMAKHLAEKNSICHAYGRSKTFIEQRQKHIEKHLQETQYAVQQFEQEIIIKMVQHGDYSPEMKVLFSVLQNFVQEKQRSTQYDYEYKREMLILDATDHQLLKEFFAAEPNKSQIISARRIWQATQKQMIIQEDIALLEYRLTSTQVQSASNLIENMINDIDNRLKQFHQTAEQFNEIKKLQDLKHDIIHQAILTSRRMADDFNTIIEKEKTKFTLENRFIQSTAPWQRLVLDAISIRRQHMIKRANLIIKHKLATFSNTSNDCNDNI